MKPAGSLLAIGRFVLAAFVGLAQPVLRLLIPWHWFGTMRWGAWVAFVLLYFALLGVSSWPLTSYRLSLRMGLVAAAFHTLSGFVIALLAYRSGSVWSFWLVLVASLLNFVLALASTSLGLCLAVYLRNRWWPVYASGYCGTCGYNLLGLASPRCPECGTRFTRGTFEQSDGGTAGTVS